MTATIAILLISSLVTVLSVIGLVDALVHAVAWIARPLMRSGAERAAHGPVGVARRGEITA